MESSTRREWIGRIGCAGLGAAVAARLSLADSSGDLASLTLKQASDRIQSKKVSPVELTEACLDRIKTFNPKINAWITVMRDKALAQAKELEKEQASGSFRGPLHGIPIGIKDTIDAVGVRTTAASAVYEYHFPTEDAEVVRRLKAAGAILIGKCNMHEFDAGATSAVSYWGPVRNPWNLDRVAGGASGGSAAAVAMNNCFAALGTDSGGAIRIPSAYCGVVGFKPTYGRVSLRGIVPFSWSLDHCGPIARTVEDAAMVLQQIAGYDHVDIDSVDKPVPDYYSGIGAPAVPHRHPRAIFRSSRRRSGACRRRRVGGPE
jgi:aspartyl-tRNA(Asn)/glutamyl-tRNA(Gln) amidotransferase subunit A